MCRIHRLNRMVVCSDAENIGNGGWAIEGDVLCTGDGDEDKSDSAAMPCDLGSGLGRVWQA